MDARGLDGPTGWGAAPRRFGAPLGRAVRRWARTAAARVGEAAPGAERLRVRAPGAVVGAEPEPGGGRVRFERSVLRVRVAAGGAVFLGWDGAEPGAGGGLREPDARATLEPDTEHGWRLVSQRVLVVVTRRGEVRLRTPGGVLLRQDAPPLWWEREAGGQGPWLLRSRLAADARVLDAEGGAVHDGAAGRVQLVLASAGAHLVGHEGPVTGRLTVRAGAAGAGSGHDRPGRAELRMAGGAPCYWLLVGSPDRVLREWAALEGRPGRG
ncbi:hypothetical protein WDH52_23585 [Streptomyces sp. TRM70308]|uniref:hypothetical protein n=1 Tax=Streptomyces sp. TRM70308 TaxID=3131932 RepID=UPI003D05DD46